MNKAEKLDYRIYDCHFNLYRNEPVRNASYIAEAKAAGINGACAFLSGLGSAGHLADNPNRETIELFAKHPDFIIPFARVHPDDGTQAIEELERLVTQEGFRGLKFSYTNKVSQPGYVDITKKAAELKIPILIHAFMGRKLRPERDVYAPLENDVLEIVELARQVPDAMIIMAHYNLGDWEFGLKAVRSISNIYPSISGSGIDSDSIEMGVRECGAERIIYGSDGYHLLYRTLGKVMGAKLSNEERKFIFGGNLERLISQRKQVLS